ncbi:hypothetical protein [Photorhabdus temperata]|uniref:Uncharacterized protein n=1 Tax=Photorhabdus temperata J3 TaxID=1389415 RepID=U7QY61_PHOTE|nr:hypothetical protein [Photorhabdus temperata]EQC00095.1 hypothetical protein B738_13478 [Photorhabdus temperata subsp. temperata M1021]ERT12988.1 hypothetical protein O185_11190 [Photorhabdus temperata J3]
MFVLNPDRECFGLHYHNVLLYTKINHKISVGGVPLEAVKQYIEQQSRPH